MNKFEASHPFVKSHLTGHHLLFGNHSENHLNVFDIYENVWLNSLKCISMFEFKCFTKMIIPYISYLQE